MKYDRPSHCQHGNPTFDHCEECLPITVMHPASVATPPAADKANRCAGTRALAADEAAAHVPALTPWGTAFALYGRRVCAEPTCRGYVLTKRDGSLRAHVVASNRTAWSDAHSVGPVQP